MNIHGVGCFLAVTEIGLVADSILGDGVSFSGELEFSFLCGAALSISTFRDLPVLTIGVLHVLGCVL